MTLKLWGKKDETDNDEEEFGEDANEFSCSYAFLFVVSNK